MACCARNRSIAANSSGVNPGMEGLQNAPALCISNPCRRPDMGGRAGTRGVQNLQKQEIATLIKLACPRSSEFLWWICSQSTGVIVHESYYIEPGREDYKIRSEQDLPELTQPCHPEATEAERGLHFRHATKERPHPRDGRRYCIILCVCDICLQ